MKKYSIITKGVAIALVSAVMAMTSIQNVSAQTRKVCIDSNWKYAYGNVNNAQQTDFNDASWRTLNLPHDWSVETDAAQAAGGTVIGPFSTNSVGKYETANTVGGEAWYRKTFVTDPSLSDKLTSLYFEGVYNYAEVYLNGIRLYFNHYGYSGFHLDITPYLRPAGEQNVLAVHAINEGRNTRWYAGSGIYRHVWLISTPKVHFKEWGTRIITESLLGTNATVSVNVPVINEQHCQAASQDALVEIISPEGSVVSSHTLPTSALAGMEEKVLSHTFSLSGIKAWSTTSPTLYTARFTMGSDVMEIPFGIRTVSFSATEGFKLNGEPMLLQGGCVHHDNGLLGAVSFDQAEERRVRLLKEQGYNALRSSHNLQSEAFLNACDRLGMLVIDECFDQWYTSKENNHQDYHLYFSEYHDRDLQVMLQRDFNHPSIIMWSIGNEIPDRVSNEGLAVGAEMQRTIHAIDTQRPVTMGVNSFDGIEGTRWWIDNARKVATYLDVMGYNYMYNVYEEDHSANTDRIMYGSETFPKRASENWNLVEKHPYIIGDFVWTAMDYLGESGIASASYNGTVPFFNQWPWFNGWCGDIDLIGQKKPQSYYRDVVWHRKPITMAAALNHSESISLWGWQQEHQDWTFEGEATEGVTDMTINVYSRAPKVRLYLDDTLIGEKTPGNTFWAGFYMKFKRGTLRAVNVENGVETDEFVLSSTGEPAAVRLTADQLGNGEEGDLVYVTAELVDAEGQVIRNSSRSVQFTCTNGTILATGNACPTDMESFRHADNQPKFFEGRALCILKRGSEAPVITGASNGLPDATLTLRRDDDTSIQTRVTACNDTVEYYSVNGTRLNAPTSGVNIVKTGDKTVKMINR